MNHRVNKITTHFLMAVFVAMFRWRMRSLSLSRAVRIWLRIVQCFFLSPHGLTLLSNCPLTQPQLILPMRWALEKEIEDSEVYGWELAKILLIDNMSHSGYQSIYYNFHGISDVQPLYSLNPSFCNLQQSSKVA